MRAVRLQGYLPAVLASGLMLAVLGYADWVERTDPDHFYQMVQEDEALEWASFWAFLLAAAANGIAVIRQRRARGGVPWFLGGLGLFCFLVAMEEISWGQRVLGYRPPSYFLEHNYQQEFNFHNVIETDLRQDAFIGLIAAYGLVLPIAMLVPPVGRWLRRAGLVAPPLLLAPGFAVALWVYIDYPWRFAGEVVELSVGLGFLFAAGLCARHLRLTSASAPTASWQDTAWIAALAAGTIALGIANAAFSQLQRTAAPEALAAARLELETLEEDFLARATERQGRIPVRCGIHKRLYTFVEHYRQRFLLRGRFSALTANGLPEERAAFLIDPWNNPYWIRSRCSDDRSRRSVFLYSFGPNRRRDSSKWEYLDDDVGVYLIRTDREQEASSDRTDDTAPTPATRTLGSSSFDRGKPREPSSFSPDLARAEAP